MATLSSELHRTVPGTPAGLKTNHHSFPPNQPKNPVNPPNQYIYARPGDPHNMIIHPAPSHQPNFSTPPPHIPAGIPAQQQQQTFQKPNFPQQVLRYATPGAFQPVPKPGGQPLVTYRLQAPDPASQYKQSVGNVQQQQQQCFWPFVQQQPEYIPVQGLHHNYVPCPQTVLSPIQSCPPGVLNPQQQVCPQPVLLNQPGVLNPHAMPHHTVTPSPPKPHPQIIPNQTRPQHSRHSRPGHLASNPPRHSHPKSPSINHPNIQAHALFSAKTNGIANPQQFPQHFINVPSVYPQFQQQQQQPGSVNHSKAAATNHMSQVVYGIQTPTISNSQKVRYPYPPPSVSPRNQPQGNPFPHNPSIPQSSQIPVMSHHPPPPGTPYQVNITYASPQPENYPVNLVPYQNPPLVTSPTQHPQTSSPPHPNTPAKLHIQYKTNADAKSSPCAFSAQVKPSETVPNHVNINQPSGIIQPNHPSGINQPNQTSANNQPCRYNQKHHQVNSPTTCQTSKPISKFGNNSKPKHDLLPPQQQQQEEIPDLRPQFLANQMLPQVGQVVLLPPLPPDRTIQTIQLLTPTTSGQFHMSTIVLPIIRLDNQHHQPPADQRHHFTIKQQPTGCHQASQAAGGNPGPAHQVMLQPQAMLQSTPKLLNIPAHNPHQPGGPVQYLISRNNPRHSAQRPTTAVAQQFTARSPQPTVIVQQSTAVSEQSTTEQVSVSDQFYIPADQVSEIAQQVSSPSAQLAPVLPTNQTLEVTSNEELKHSDDELVKFNEPSDVVDEVVDQDATGEKPADDNDAVEDDFMLNQLESTGLPSVIEGIDLDKVKQFASDFKQARLDLGLTQSQVGADLQNTLSSISQSTICRFERLEITAGQVKRLLPALQQWLTTAQERQATSLAPPVADLAPVNPPPATPSTAPGDIIKKRKKRTVFSPSAVLVLCAEYAINSSPSSADMARIAEGLGHHKETVRVWFCNKRQKEAGIRKQQEGEEATGETAAATTV